MIQQRSWLGIFVPVMAIGLIGGCDVPASRKTFDSLRDVENLIGGRSANSGVLGASQEKVVELLGKPDFVHAGGRLSDRSDDEVWKYHDTVKHKATGKMQTLIISFSNERVLQVDLE